MKKILSIKVPKIYSSLNKLDILPFSVDILPNKFFSSTNSKVESITRINNTIDIDIKKFFKNLSSSKQILYITRGRSITLIYGIDDFNELLILKLK